MSGSESEHDYSDHDNYSDASTIAVDDLDQLEEIEGVEMADDDFSFEGLKILGQLKKGAFRSVFKVLMQEGVHKGKKFVLKQEARHGRRIIPQVAALQQMEHKNVVKMVQSHIDDENIYFLTEYAAQGNLADAMSHFPDRKLPVQWASRAFKQVVDGIEYVLSRNFAHCEIRPKNVLVFPHGVHKICNFRHAKKLRNKVDASITYVQKESTAAYMSFKVLRENGVSVIYVKGAGDFSYMPPEVFQGDKYKARYVDLWSAGIMLATLLQGKTPWQRPSVSCSVYWDFLKAKYNKPLVEQYWKGIDRLAFDVIKKLLDRSPSARMIETVKATAFYQRAVHREERCHHVCGRH